MLVLTRRLGETIKYEGGYKYVSTDWRIQDVTLWNHQSLKGSWGAWYSYGRRQDQAYVCKRHSAWTS